TLIQVVFLIAKFEYSGLWTSLSSEKTHLEMLEWGLPTLLSHSFLERKDTTPSPRMKSCATSDLQSRTYISLTFSFSPCTTPSTVPLEVLRTQPLSSSSSAFSLLVTLHSSRDLKVSIEQHPKPTCCFHLLQ
ncbi:unnamed protein product, partial [Ixodes persulcatus]